MIVVCCIFVACGGADQDPCEETLPSSCSPLYEPTFTQVYTQTLQVKCAVTGGACHSAAGAKGGLILEGEDAAYAGLVESGRVIPGEPECGELTHRLESTDAAIVMPVGGNLSEPERCAIYAWIRAGALR